MYNTEWFIEQMKIRRPEDYDEYIILGEYVNYNTKIKAYHKPCERNIYITPREFLSKRKLCDSTYTRTAREALKGCNRCNRRFNRTINDIKEFDYLYHTNKLSYDFYLPEYSILIEYQGEQHVRPIEHFGGMETFILQQKLDKLKSDYAYNNGYKLIEILYTNNDYKSIENILNKNLF